jgi:hypothetical protein
MQKFRSACTSTPLLIHWSNRLWNRLKISAKDIDILNSETKPFVEMSYLIDRKETRTWYFV